MTKQKLKEFKDAILGILVIGFVIWFFIPGKTDWEIAEQKNQAYSDKTRIDVTRDIELGYPKIDEEHLVKVVGLTPIKRYALEDGYGLKFRAENQPSFSLEFRDHRVNISWDNYYDDPVKHGDMNKANRDLAQHVLSAALGANVGKDVFAYYQDLQPVSIQTLMHKINVSPSRGFTLITIAESHK